jgi:hypothetical protein
MERKRNLRALFVMVVMSVAVYSHGQNRTSYQQVVKMAETSVLLSSSANPAILANTPVFTAHVTGKASIPTGTAVFSAVNGVNQTVGASVPVDSSGNAVWNAGLPSGNYSVTASYSGDANYLGSNSPALLQVVDGPSDFTLSIAGATAVIKQGDSWTSGVTVQGINGFAGVVLLSCGNLPPKMACNFGSSSLQAGATAVQTPVVVSTVATTLTTVAGGMLIFGMLLCRRRPARLSWLTFSCLGCIGLLSLLLSTTGCGVGMRYEQADGTPKGTYQVMLTGTAGVLSHSQSINVTVQ